MFAEGKINGATSASDCGTQLGQVFCTVSVNICEPSNPQGWCATKDPVLGKAMDVRALSIVQHGLPTECSSDSRLPEMPTGG